MLEVLRAQQGAEFKKAAQFYETFKGRVHLADRNDPMLVLSCADKTCNSKELIAGGQVIRNYETNKVTDIYLANVLSPSDLAMSAHHEGLLHVGENIRGHPSTLSARALAAWNQMSAADQASAPYNRQALRAMGVLQVPKMPVYVQPPQ